MSAAFEPAESTMAFNHNLFQVPADIQELCLLFTLPVEIRRIIWEFVLTDYPDQSEEKRYAQTTYYTRPDYEAPRKSDLRLLRTCRAVYFESWEMPFLLREQTWWLTEPMRHPKDFNSKRAYTRLKTAVHANLARKCAPGTKYDPGAIRSSDEVDTIDLRVFAQMYKLEAGYLDNILRWPEVRPRRLTLTIRHADWWFWEDDEPLRFEAGWLESVSSYLGQSTCEIVIELETVLRKSAQLQHVADHIARTWFFRRRDGVVLFGDTTCRSHKRSTWQGASAWRDKRWVRDECSPGKIDYRIIAVPFRLQAVIERNGGEVNDGFQTAPYNPRSDEGHGTRGPNRNTRLGEVRGGPA